MVRPPSVDRAVVHQIINGTHHEPKLSTSTEVKKKSSESKMSESESARKKKKKVSKIGRKKKSCKKKRSVRRDSKAQVEEEQRQMELQSEPHLEERMLSLKLQEESKDEAWHESMFRLTFFTYLNFYYDEAPESKPHPAYVFSHAKAISRADYVIPPVGSLSQLPLVTLVFIIQNI